MKYTNEDLQYLRSNYSFEQKEAILSHLQGHSWISIMSKASKLGLSRPRTIRKPKLHGLIDTTLENCYWWGFIYSDGYLSATGKLVVQLSNLDRDHLDKLATKLSAPVYEAKGNMCRIDVMDKVSTECLRNKLGIKAKKTYSPPDNFEFLSTPDERLAFLLGFIDGDGSLRFDHNGSFKSLKVVVHENWFDFFENFCHTVGQDFDLRFTVTKNGRGNTSVYMGTKKSHRDLVNFINQYQIPAMDRKWNNRGKGFNINDHHNDRN